MTALLPLLLVDDSVQDIRLTLNALQQCHVSNEVIVCRDGVDALEYLRRQGQFALRAPRDPAVVLLDIKMPKMDGIQVLKEMRADPKLKRIPVVMLTSSCEERDMLQSYDLGVNAYVVKPVDFPQFIMAIKEIGIFWAVINTPPPSDSGEESA